MVTITLLYPEAESLVEPAGSEPRAAPAGPPRIFQAKSGTIDSRTDGGALVIEVHLPLRQTQQMEITVLVVEDHRDLVDLYQSYCVGTNYTIEAIALDKGYLKLAPAAAGSL
jgi:hypothetical protein